jgi:tRNA-Thr(GGU) m(6)t(6)A37 methyltransferase TsaA
MNPGTVTLSQIGVIHSPFKDLKGMPIQPAGAEGVIGRVVIEPAYAPGLRDLEGFSHIYLIYYFHKATKIELEVKPFLDDQVHGVFATRSPLRPAHIGLSIVKLISVDKNQLVVAGIDVLDGTPLLDIKPYIASFDQVCESQNGWMSSSRKEIAEKRSDDRFIE